MIGQNLLDAYCQLKVQYLRMHNRCEDLSNQCRMQQEQIQHMRKELQKPRDLQISVATQQWIPCVDRYPVKELREHLRYFDDDDVEVIAMVRDTDIATSLYYNGHSFCDSDGIEYDVVAWMPMPEPYNEVLLSDGE